MYGYRYLAKAAYICPGPRRCLSEHPAQPQTAPVKAPPTAAPYSCHHTARSG
jgi:hypothetical protein